MFLSIQVCVCIEHFGKMHRKRVKQKTQNGKYGDTYFIVLQYILCSL